MLCLKEVLLKNEIQEELLKSIYMSKYLIIKVIDSLDNADDVSKISFSFDNEKFTFENILYQDFDEEKYLFQSKIYNKLNDEEEFFIYKIFDNSGNVFSFEENNFNDIWNSNNWI